VSATPRTSRADSTVLTAPSCLRRFCEQLHIPIEYETSAKIIRSLVSLPSHLSGGQGATLAVHILNDTKEENWSARGNVVVGLARGGRIQEALDLYINPPTSLPPNAPTWLATRILKTLARGKNLEGARAFIAGLRGEVGLEGWSIFCSMLGRAGETEELSGRLEEITCIAAQNRDDSSTAGHLADILHSSFLCFERLSTSPEMALAFYSALCPHCIEGITAETMLSLFRQLALQVGNTSGAVADMLEEFISQGGGQDAREARMLYVGAITALHRNGLFDEADIIFARGVSDKHLSFAIMDDSEKIILDLHDMNIATSLTAVRAALFDAMNAAFRSGGGMLSTAEFSKDVILITGRGAHSKRLFKPVLRPEVQRYLLEDFYPPLSTSTVVGNTGAIRILKSDVEAWMQFNMRKKNAHIFRLSEVISFTHRSVGNAMSRLVWRETEQESRSGEEK